LKTDFNFYQLRKIIKTTKLAVFMAVVLLTSNFTFSSCKNCNGNKGKNNGKDNGKNDSVIGRDKDKNKGNSAADGDKGNSNNMPEDLNDFNYQIKGYPGNASVLGDSALGEVGMKAAREAARNKWEETAKKRGEEQAAEVLDGKMEMIRKAAKEQEAVRTREWGRQQKRRWRRRWQGEVSGSSKGCGESEGAGDEGGSGGDEGAGGGGGEGNEGE
jgi:hypothetical protein